MKNTRSVLCLRFDAHLAPKQQKKFRQTAETLDFTYAPGAIRTPGTRLRRVELSILQKFQVCLECPKGLILLALWEL